MPVIIKRLLLVGLTFFIISCSSSPQSRLEYSGNYTERGIASYYADKYQSRKTASGERFNQFARTAAHKRLPFGSIVRVTNIKNGKSVVVRINDRGPFVKGRIIDLSKSAFNAIGSTRSGIIDVKIKIVH